MTQQSSSNFCSLMAPMILLMFILAMVGGSDAAWCICKPDASASNLQKALDYACGAGADCNPIHQNGACYIPNSVLAHCSYAANSYYQRNGQNQQACDFSGAAQISSSDPSQPGCTFPATPSAAGTSTSTSTTSPSTSTTPGTPNSTPTTTSPGSSNTTPIVGGGGGGGGGGTNFNPNSPTTTTGSSFGMGPSTVGFDGSHGTTNFHPNPIIYYIFVLAVALFKF